jgi:spermidine/putrescine transport system ATP-binding protein
MTVRLEKATAESAQPGSPPAIQVDKMVKRFGGQSALRGVTLAIEEGEFFSLLGPSGCGKTTLLRILAGFLEPDAGEVRLRGDDVTRLPPNKRPVNMVFQHYELFPHMTVFENVAYGLKRKRVRKDEIRERVYSILDVLGVRELEKRNASQLSGGQQQRVAVARALVNRPAVLLLDEPLSALDVKLRKRMQLELKSIQHELRTTFVYVTHDQEEALLMSDRVGVMHDGLLLQVGTPREIYDHPANAFVADFVGTLNDLGGVVTEVATPHAFITFPDGSHIALRADQFKVGDSVSVAVRPEQIVIEGPAASDSSGPGMSILHGTIVSVDFVGSLTRYVVAVPALGEVVVHSLSRTELTNWKIDDRVSLRWSVDSSILL